MGFLKNFKDWKYQIFAFISTEIEFISYQEFFSVKTPPLQFQPTLLWTAHRMLFIGVTNVDYL